MEVKELNELYNRLNEMPDNKQILILAGLYGTISVFAQKGDETSLYLIEYIKEKVEAWEDK